MLSSDPPARWGCPVGTVWWILGALKAGDLWSIASAGILCQGGDKSLRRNDAPSLARAFKNLLNLEMPVCTVFSLPSVHFPPRRREMYWPILHMKTTLQLKLKMLRVHLEQYFYLLKPSTSLPNRMRLSL
jgi:hypothetical protein